MGGEARMMVIDKSEVGQYGSMAGYIGTVLELLVDAEQLSNRSWGLVHG